MMATSAGCYWPVFYSRRRAGPDRETGLCRDLSSSQRYLSGLSYTLSGLTKLESPLWQSGEALAIVLAGPIARDSGKWLLDLGPLLRILSYVSLALEILAGPLAFLRLGRKIAWISLTLFHTGILIFLNVGSVSLAMLVLQLYLFDSDWLASLRLRRRIAESIRARRTSQAQPYQSIP
ncbi:MAG: hypothetical protein HS115_12290 [Spirochaetales bacterium]|nr:hypothetical protein [Spirochaetales bacterium]